MVMLLHTPAWPQVSVAPSQVTPPTLRPPQPSAPVRIDPLADIQPAKTADDGLEVLVGEVIVEGGLSDLDVSARELKITLTNRLVTLGAIRASVVELERSYAERGYFLIRVVLPPQRLTDGGLLRVVVINGYVEAVETSAVPKRVRSVVERLLTPLINKQSLTLDEAERRLQQAGATAGLILRSTLASGDQPGATRLLLEGTHRLLGGSLRLGNTQPRALGTLDSQASFAVNSAWGAGERIYAAWGVGRSGLNQNSDHGYLRLVAGGVALPLGDDGWSINPEVTETVTRPAPEPDALRTRGRLIRSTVRLTRPAIATSQSAGFGGQIALEKIDQIQSAPDFDVNLSRDQYRVLRLGLDVATPSIRGTLSYSRGLGGRDPTGNSEPLSRSGARLHFDRLGIFAQGSWRRSNGWGADLTAIGQYAFNRPMLTSEQFALSGHDAVSGFTPGSLPADQGATLRGELKLPSPHHFVTETFLFAPYAFAATGYGRLFEPTAVELAGFRARSAGLGMRIRAFSAYGPMDLQLEAARRLGDSDEGGWRAQVTLNLGL